MASHPTTPPKRGRAFIPPAATLALWRLRHTWRLLTIAGLGIVAAAMLVATVPLFSNVAASAGLRDSLSALSQNADITASLAVFQSQSGSLQTGNDYLQTLSPIIDHDMQQHLGPYLRPGAPGIVADIGLRPLYTLQSAKSGKTTILPTPNLLDMLGQDMSAVANHVTVVRGRLPDPGAATLEIALTAETAKLLGVDLNSRLSTQLANLSTTATTAAQLVPLNVVGIVQPNDPQDPYWLGHDGLAPESNGSGATYIVLAPLAPLLTAMGPIGAFSPVLNNGGGPVKGFNGPPPQFFWLYQLDVGRLNSAALGDLITRLNDAQSQFYNDISNAGVQPTGGIFSQAQNVLQDFQGRLIGADVITTVLLIEITALLIFFISMMAEILVDRQSEAIAVLRSRGASRGQIFGAFAAQSLGVGVLAFVAGPLLADLAVRALVSTTLTAQDQQALNVIPASPLQVIWDLRWFVGIAAAAAVGAMLIAINRAANQDILSARREAARTGRRPLWQRLNLDVVFAVIALGAYGVYVYVTNIAGLPPYVLQSLSVLGIIAPIFVMIGAVLLFLRVFPLLLRLGARLASRGRRAAPMLALAQMSRAPRQAVRMTLLLALSTAFALFVLIFSASQSQRLLDVTAYQTVADFSGTLPVYTAAAQPTLAVQTATYSAIPGVRAASLGYTTSSSSNNNFSSPGPISVGVAGPGGNQSDVVVLGVDAATFAQTAIWSDQYSSQSLASLMQTLFNGRAAAAANDEVPVIVDDQAWSQFRLTPGARFTDSVPGYNGGSMHFVVVGRVHHLPSVYNYQGQGQGGLLVDYPSYAAVYATDLPGQTLAPNTAWLRTAGDGASLASVRAALNQNATQLTQMQDRRALVSAGQKNPLQLELLGVLEIGAVTAMLLALIGNLVASWLSARNRQTNFAVLRALGTNTRQVASVLLTEQGIVYSAALALGILFGALLAALVLPLMVFTNLLNTSGSTFYLAQFVPPVRAVWPLPTLGIALGAIVAACAVALGIMTRVATRPSVSQTLRLNED